MTPTAPTTEPTSRPPTAADVTFALCVEAGGFEPQTVRAVQSLRRFGGRFADCPVIAVTPRAGVPIARATRRALADLGVSYANVRPPNRYPWYSMSNKCVTVAEAERRATTVAVCWIDSDILITGQPDLLDLPADVDLVACPADKNIGTPPGGDENTPYWEQIATAVGLPLDALPWVRAYREDVDVRLYFNGGVFAFRRGSGMTAAYTACTDAILDAKVSSRNADVYFSEQASIGLAAVKAGLRWRALPHAYNYAVGKKILPLYEASKVAAGVVLHYHDMMWPEQWPTLLGKLKVDRPDVHDWLAPLGPIRPPASPLGRLVGKWVGNRRRSQAEKHKASCAVY